MDWKRFDLHPKPATSVRQRSVVGGLLTTCTILFALVLAVFLAQIDLFETTEVITIDSIRHGDKHLVKFDVTFIRVPRCATLHVEVVDALGRVVIDARSEILSAQMRDDDSCRVVGTLEIPAGRGTFRIAPQLDVKRDAHNHHQHNDDEESNNMELAYFGNTHQINALSVGDDISLAPGRSLSTTQDASHADVSGFWTYFLNLVPTRANGLHGYQVAATRTFHAQPINPALPLNNNIIGSIYFVYEISAMQMIINNQPTFMTLAHFTARVIGITGGLFSIVAALREIATKIGQAVVAGNTKLQL